MRPIRPSLRSLNLLPSSTSRTLCPACHRAYLAPIRALSTTPSHQAPNAVPFTEKLRRKIWGTDSPPGRPDPYSKESVVDQANKAKQEPEGPKEDELDIERVKAVPTVARDDASYEPAATWDGLEEVGDYEEFWEEEWTKEHQFQGYLPAKRLSTPEELTAALHRAVVEVFTLRQAGRPLSDIKHGLRADEASGDPTANVQIEVDANGQLTLESTNDSILTQILSSFPVESTATTTTPTATEDETATEATATETGANKAALADATASRLASLRARISQYDPSWLSLPLQTAELKFALHARLLALTSHPIPDPLLSSPALTTQDILTHLLLPHTKPRKIADALLKNEKLTSLPNVAIHNRRITPIDREVQAGRWKEIVSALEEKGLPVTGGHRSEARNRQKAQKLRGV